MFAESGVLGMAESSHFYLYFILSLDSNFPFLLFGFQMAKRNTSSVPLIFGVLHCLEDLGHRDLARAAREAGSAGGQLEASDSGQRGLNNPRARGV